jgi:hypothetical protein
MGRVRGLVHEGLMMALPLEGHWRIAGWESGARVVVLRQRVLRLRLVSSCGPHIWRMLSSVALHRIRTPDCRGAQLHSLSSMNQPYQPLNTEVMEHTNITILDISPWPLLSFDDFMRSLD